MLKTHSYVVFLVAVLILMLPRTSVAAPVVSFVPAAAHLTVGDSLSLDVAVTGIDDLYAWQLDLGFDPAVFRVDDIVEGSFLATGGETVYIPGTVDNVLGVVSFTANSLLGPTPGVGGSGILATLNIRAFAPGASRLELFNVVMLASGLEEIPDVTVEGADVTVRGAGSVPEPPTVLLVLIGAMQVFSRGRRACQSRKQPEVSKYLSRPTVSAR
jgi:hypothetical protein